MISPIEFVNPCALLIALGLDHAFGEPPAKIHPVVWMGTLLRRLGRGLSELDPAQALIAGALRWILGASLSTALAFGMEHATLAVAQPHSWIRALGAAFVIGVLLKPLFAWQFLRKEVISVERALGDGIDAGRLQIARLASRNAAALTDSEIRETAIESLAENLNDSVIAPFLWFAIAGLPGAALYRFANTADAMWGYRGRWEWAGKWAARADDLLSFIPARLTALSLLAPTRWRKLSREAHRTPSPNGGWPMGAMALRLKVRLRKPGVNVLNGNDPSPTAEDTARAIRLATTVLYLLVPPLLVLAMTRRSSL